jgi:hypothetical protein
MPAEKTDANEALIWAAAKISRANDEMIVALPADADLSKAALD